MLKPTKVKILSTLVLVVAIFGATVLLSPSVTTILAMTNWWQKFLMLALNIVVLGIFFYPFVCGITLIYRKVVTKIKIKTSEIVTAIILILLFNPFTFFLANNALNSFLNSKPFTACGVTITGFAENAPAEIAGVMKGEVITALDGKDIETQQALLDLLAAKVPGNVVVLTTDKKSYSITLGQKPGTNAAMLGVKVEEKNCK